MSKETSHLIVISGNPEETFFVGRIIGENLIAGDTVALIGELGAGKTCFTQGVARGMGIPEEYKITSPSFTLINEYPGKITLYHFDLYRLQGSQDMEDMGYDEYLFGEGVSVIEWAEKMKDVLPAETLFVSFTYLDENEREILFSGQDKKITQIAKALKNGGL